MTQELGPKAYPDYAVQILDYFYARPETAEERLQYTSRGLIPTNNLAMYIVDSPNPELVTGTGVKNHYDYNQRPFGPVITSFRETNPGLWERAKAAAALSEQLSSRYAELMFSGRREEAEAIAPSSSEAYWAKAAVFDEVIRYIAPDLQDLGIEPLDLCK